MSHATNHHPLRKAAILVASLDRETADRLVAQMPAGETELLFAEIARLGEIDSAEQRTIIDEFFRGSPAVAESGDTLELSSTVEEQLAAADFVQQHNTMAAPPSPNFEPLRSTDAATLATILTDERPQVVALVMSQLLPQQAAEVLTRLSSTMQVEVMRRLSDLDEPDTITLCEVERVLSGRLDHAVRAHKRRATGLATLDGILQAAEGSTSRKLLDHLAQHDHQLAARLRRDEPAAAETLPAILQPPMTYAEFTRLDDRSLRRVFQSAEREIVLLALAGSTPQFVARVAALVGATNARQLDQAIESLGPLLLSDLEAAQDELARLASEQLDEAVVERVSPRRTMSIAA